MKKIALLLARRAAALFNAKFRLCRAPTGSLRRQPIVFIQTSTMGPGGDQALAVV